MTKKKFALAQIAPYYKDPRTCGVDGSRCVYLTPDGRMCVAGKNMIDPSKWLGTIGGILSKYDQSEVFKPEVVDILTTQEWRTLQLLHDKIGMVSHGVVRDEIIKLYITELNLFSLEELEEYSKTLA